MRLLGLSLLVIQMLVAQEPKTLVTGEHMSLTHPWRKVATTISTIALVGSGLAIAAPAAQAASTLSGPSQREPFTAGDFHSR